MDVSVVICSFNGSKTIERTLLSIFNQNTDLKYEVIFVDNNSQDNTLSIVQAIKISEGSEKVIILSEPTPGKVHALRKGICQSIGSVIVICDDDNFLSPDYLNNAFELLMQNSKIGLACGINRPIADTDLPDWFERYQILFGCGQIAEDSGDVTAKGSIWGAGMVCKGDLMRSIYSSGIRHFASGSFARNGFRLGGEDNELCFWVIYLGYKLWFSKKLVLDHFMLFERLNLEYLEKLTSGIIAGNSHLRLNLDIVKRALKPIWKRDYLMMFIPGTIGRVARIKFGLQPRNDIHRNNVLILKRIKSQLIS